MNSIMMRILCIKGLLHLKGYRGGGVEEFIKNARREEGSKR